MSLDLLSRTKVEECHWIYSKELKLWKVIGFTQQDSGCGMSLDLLSRTKVGECHWIYSARLPLRNFVLQIGGVLELF